MTDHFLQALQFLVNRCPLLSVYLTHMFCEPFPIPADLFVQLCAVLTDFVKHCFCFLRFPFQGLVLCGNGLRVGIAAA
jgi:hypothetical protein